MLSKVNKLQIAVSMIAAIILVGATAVSAQDDQVRSLINGQKYKIDGVIVARDADSILIKDETGVNTKVVINPTTSIKSNSFWGSGDRYAESSLVRGLLMKAEGRGDGSGALSAQKIRFDKSDLEVAQSIDSRVGPAEERITQAEQNAERISGQIDELMAISNAARGGAKAAQDTADAAVAGVNATNSRISALDDYVVQSTATVNFRVASYKLSPDAAMQLDDVATAAQTLRGYVIEVTGFASSDGSAAANKRLSEQRARAVIDYLVTNHNIPLRRIGMSYGFGEAQAVADNSTREGRAQNRRVEVKLMVSRGLNQNVEVRQAPDTDDGTK